LRDSEFKAKREINGNSPTGSDQAYSDEDESTPHVGDGFDKDNSLEEEESKEYELRKSIVEKTQF